MTMLTGIYYSFDCMNAFLEDKLFPASAFASDREAIRTAANYEATLYKHTYNHLGVRTSTKTIYDPWQ